MKKLLEKYFLLAFTLFSLPMKGSMVNSNDHQGLIDDIVEHASEKEYKQLKNKLETFNGKSLDFNRPYTPSFENQIDADLDDCYSSDKDESQTLLQYIFSKIGQLALFDLNILRLFFYYGAEKERLYIELRKRKFFLHEIFRTSYHKKLVEVGEDYDKKLMAFLINKTDKDGLIDKRDEKEEALLELFIKLIARNRYLLSPSIDNKISDELMKYIVRYLLIKGASPNSKNPSNGKTAFYLLCSYGYSDLYDLFFEFKADPNVKKELKKNVSKKGQGCGDELDGTTPTYLAFYSSKGYLSDGVNFINSHRNKVPYISLQFLLYGADLYAEASDNSTPIGILEKNYGLGIKRLLGRFKRVVHYYLATCTGHHSIPDVYLYIMYKWILHEKMHKKLLSLKKNKSSLRNN